MPKKPHNPSITLVLTAEEADIAGVTLLQVLYGLSMDHYLDRVLRTMHVLCI
ncbi:hypothetical protein BO70DRAFT_365943 [Aspergillus heteromorphus CBS 117.55]|uniref:Uncharacterized protein n=1 Tax=Aspergillus heteromorphus CBS 117.55 TaxID=1448321 RepID=A0A317V550_9EURO|nr:uncharacterized protein BO70DRAFT_365943 [Aspergillus heteromorphus CBS 117.55]PWY69126.1 hypothetical protein BO70DRAFT_365943 [Aspergillus heteromorphus CBS 117.55]